VPLPTEHPGHFYHAFIINISKVGKALGEDITEPSLFCTGVLKKGTISYKQFSRLGPPRYTSTYFLRALPTLLKQREQLNFLLSDTDQTLTPQAYSLSAHGKMSESELITIVCEATTGDYYDSPIVSALR
jgi:hypothetical protein